MTAFPCRGCGTVISPGERCSCPVVPPPIARAMKAKQTAEDELTAIAAALGVTLLAITSTDRHRTIARARHVAMYVLRERRRYSYPELGRIFGHRDHTSAMHGVHKIDRLLKVLDQETLEDVAASRAAFVSEPTQEAVAEPELAGAES